MINLPRAIYKSETHIHAGMLSVAHAIQTERGTQSSWYVEKGYPLRPE